jgi:hypothetical protein
MNPIIRNILAVIAGWLGGSIVNMGLVKIGNSVFPMEGYDLSDMESLTAAMPNMTYENFIFPFLAHALGTLVGAFIAAYFAANNNMKFAYGIGVFFLLGGIMVNYMLPGPTWFTIIDIAFSYIPMAFIGGSLAIKFLKK